MFPFPTPCKGKSKSQPFAHTFALTGRRRLYADTQGVALGCELVALSGRSFSRFVRLSCVYALPLIIWLKTAQSFFLDVEHPTFQRRCHPLLVSNIITTGTPISGVMAFTGRVRPPGTAWPRRSAKSAMLAPQSRLMGRSVWWLAV